MFNGMMDPELIRLALEQMSRISPAEFQRMQQQMMSNPDLMRMASESIKNMRPEDLIYAAEQFKHTRPEEMAEIGEKIANSSPEEIAAMRARLDDQLNYALDGAQFLKKQGNELHNQGRFNDASQKYLLAKKNLQGIPISNSKTVLLACSLNLMSCYLKTRQYDKCINEGSEVLEYDERNVKALYRRGQAYKELGQLEDAVSDLSKAHEVSPDDETIADVLRDAKEQLNKGGARRSSRLVVKEVAEDAESVSSSEPSSSVKNPVRQPQGTNGILNVLSKDHSSAPTTSSESLKALNDDPDAIRSFQNFISNADPDSLAALGGAEAVSPDIFKSASNMISKMSPDELQRMVQMASSFQGQNPNMNGSRPGAVNPNVTPEMLQAATGMMSMLPSEDLQKMFEMASSVEGQKDIPAAAGSIRNELSSDSTLKSSEAAQSSINGSNAVTATSTSQYASSSSSSNLQPIFPGLAVELQEQMRNQMKDPAMRQMFTSMIKNMDPDMMANMSEQFGMKLSREDAVKAQQAMSSLSPENLDRMMNWADKIQRGADGVKKTKKWLLGKSGWILAICILILAMILHRLGYIGT